MKNLLSHTVWFSKIILAIFYLFMPFKILLSQSKAWEGTITIPTYGWEDDVNPKFWAMEAGSKGATNLKASITYPYNIQNHLSRKLEDVTYKAILFTFLLLNNSNSSTMNNRKQVSKESKYTYLVNRTRKPPEINSGWNKQPWKKTGSVSLDNYMGTRPEHFPPTRAKLRYDEENIYVIFKVSDRYVKAVEKNRNGKVWMDSCVEFFFSPGPDTERGYFNFEINCKGVFLFQYHTDGGKIKEFVNEEDSDRIEVSWSLERNAEEEITEPIEWTVEYSIPFSILSNYMNVEKPGPGVTWRANFYKCADKTSHPHWLTWAPVDYPSPKFHLPEFFGWLEFE